MPETDNDDAATSSVWCGDDSSCYVQQPDLACHNILQEPGSFYIANLWAARSCVKHTAAEPMFEHDDAGVHITVTLLTDVYTVHGPTPRSKFDWLIE